jgi:hypothetical protein
VQVTAPHKVDYLSILIDFSILNITFRNESFFMLHKFYLGGGFQHQPPNTTPAMVTSMSRNRPSWMNPVNETNTPAMRFLPGHLGVAVDEIVKMVDELHDNDRGWLDDHFLEEEVFKLEEVFGIPFYSQEQEIAMYMEFRSRACDIEETIFDLMRGEGKYPGDAMQQWRHCHYQDILKTSRELSVVLAACEPTEDDGSELDEDEEGDMGGDSEMESVTDDGLDSDMYDTDCEI